VAGDDAAWEQLIARHERHLFSIARRTGLSRQDAEDAFQRVCIRLYHWLPAIREPDHLASWLTVTMTREAIRAAHRARRSSTFDPSDETAAPWRNEPRDERPLADEDMLELERARALASALDALPERCRIIMRAFLGQGGNYREIAERLGIPIGSLGPFRARCLARLKRLLRERGFE
jgi:RNA polymerase sigma factor (sigma-70 family)